MGAAKSPIPTFLARISSSTALSMTSLPFASRVSLRLWRSISKIREWISCPRSLTMAFCRARGGEIFCLIQSWRSFCRWGYPLYPIERVNRRTVASLVFTLRGRREMVMKAASSPWERKKAATFFWLLVREEYLFCSRSSSMKRLSGRGFLEGDFYIEMKLFFQNSLNSEKEISKKGCDCQGENIDSIYRSWEKW